MNKNYILNKTTGKIELHFEKQEYNDLSFELKEELKSAYLFSSRSKVWVSRSKNNHFRAIRVARKIGFTEQVEVGRKSTYSEEVEKKIEKAETKQERYDTYSENAKNRGKSLQKELDSYRGDIAFFTQPIIVGHKGSESFKRQREKIFNRYRKGLEEYRKSDYFKSKSQHLDSVINGEKYKDRSYLTNRIKECNKNIKIYEKNIGWCEENEKLDRIEHWLEKLEYEIDKLGYMQNALDQIGGVKYNTDNLKVGYQVKVKGYWETILKINKTTITVQPIEERIKTFISKYSYSEIEDIRIPENFPINGIQNPFSENEIMVSYSYSGNRILEAYKIIKVTEKSVVLQQLVIIDNIPTETVRLDSKPKRRNIKKNIHTDDICIYDNKHQLYKYSA